jgi:PAS domain S-box-containing protein
MNDSMPPDATGPGGLQAAAARLPLPLFLLDAGGGIVWLNDAARELVGDDADGRRITELLEPVDGAPGDIGFQDGAWRGDMIARGPRGAVEVDARVLPLAGGPADPAALLVAVDITVQRRDERRRRAERAVTIALAEVEEFDSVAEPILAALGEALDLAFGAAWIVDGDDEPKLRCVAVWRSPERDDTVFEEETRRSVFTSGVGLPGIVYERAQPVWIADFPDDERFPRRHTAADAGLHAAFGFPILFGGRVRGVVEFFSPEIREPDADLLASVRGIGAELGQYLERRQAQSQVREAEARRAAVLDVALDAIISIDDEGHVLDWNPAAERTFGWSRDEVAGRRLSELIIPPRDRPAHEAGLRRYLETGESRILNSRVELEALRRSGSLFPVELTLGRVDLPSGGAFTAHIRDISTRRRDEQRAVFLAETADLLIATALDPVQRLRALAEMVVPRLADWCVIDLIGEDGLKNVALIHRDPNRVEIAQRLRGAPDWERERGIVATVVETGRPVLMEEITDEVLQAAAPAGQYLDDLRRLQLRSAVIVPLIARGRTIGALTMVLSESDRRFDATDLAFVEDVARRAALAVDNAELYQREQHIASTLQNSLLPASLPDMDGAEVAALYQPAGAGNEVGGDFYDLWQIGPGEFSVAVGDVAGRGPAAAALTALMRHVIYATSLHEPSPAAALRTLNEAVWRRTDRTRFCTVCLIRLRRTQAGWHVTLSSGGHPLPVIRRASGEVTELGRPGTLVGVAETINAFEDETDLGPDDTIVVWTDGVVEQRVNGELFGEGRLRDVIAAWSPRSGSAQLIEDVLESLERFGGGAGKEDDRALLIVRAMKP